MRIKLTIDLKASDGKTVAKKGQVLEVRDTEQYGFVWVAVKGRMLLVAPEEYKEA